MKNFNMVYLYVDENNEIIGAYENVDDALNDLLEYNNDNYVFISDEKLAAIFTEAHERMYKKDNAWADVVWLDDDDVIKGTIFQRPLIKSKKEKKA